MTGFRAVRRYEAATRTIAVLADTDEPFAKMAAHSRRDGDGVIP
jgi:hypothetical protein